jgi:hypothetical protein
VRTGMVRIVGRLVGLIRLTSISAVALHRAGLKVHLYEAAVSGLA